MKFSCIVCDPPVPFNAYDGPSLPARRFRAASAACHYRLMTWEEIHGLRPWIDGIAADDCALFLWICNPHIPEMVRLLDSWGFEFKTAAFVWVKLNRKLLSPFSGLGYWSRANSEQVWLATRGRVDRLAKDVRQIIELIERPDGDTLRLPLQKHSQKPEQIQDSIERLVGGPYLEMFARRQRPGWCCVGNEIDGLDIRAALEQVAQLDVLEYPPSVIEQAVRPQQSLLFDEEVVYV